MMHRFRYPWPRLFYTSMIKDKFHILTAHGYLVYICYVFFFIHIGNIGCSDTHKYSTISGYICTIIHTMIWFSKHELITSNTVRKCFSVYQNDESSNLHAVYDEN